MRAHAPRVALLILLLAATADGRQSAPAPPPAPPPLPVARLEAHRNAASADLAAAERRFLHFAGDQRQLDEAAAIAWRYVTKNYVPATGLIAAVPNYDYAT
ncbi:MAG TPA: hypothetical protein VMN81_09850, partial [Vicinamibacterales bacterium]|nr:hypothetical protein [Vicinamibacterales bacterium]